MTNVIGMRSDNDTQVSVGSSPKNIIHIDEIFVDLPTSTLGEPIIKQKLNKSCIINIIITHIYTKLNCLGQRKNRYQSYSIALL